MIVSSSLSMTSLFSIAWDIFSRSPNLAIPETLKTAKGIFGSFLPLSMVLIISNTVVSKSSSDVFPSTE